MKIKSIKATIHRIHAEVPLLKHPLARKIVFCELETDEGHKGYGLTGGAYLPVAVATAINKEFLPVVKDMDPRDTEAIHEKVWWKMNQRSTTLVRPSPTTMAKARRAPSAAPLLPPAMASTIWPENTGTMTSAKVEVVTRTQMIVTSGSRPDQWRKVKPSTLR